MASPFHIFRKHQKLMIAVLCLMAMIAFVFLPMVAQSQQERQAIENPVVVATKKYGDLRESNLQAMQFQRQRLYQFLVQATVEAGTANQDLHRYLEVVIFDGLTESSTVRAWLLTHHAKELGLVVDDVMVTDFLYDATGNRLGKPEFAGLYQRLRTSEKEIFDAMHDVLLAWRLREMMAVGLAASPPAQRWGFHQRLYRTVNAEVAAVPVDNFRDAVPDPTDEQLEAFFNKHKERFSNPSSPEPGFRVPKKVAVEYIKADFEKFVKAEVDKVSREEIERFYNENREQFRNADLPGLDLDSPAEKKPDEKTDEKDKPKADQEPKAGEKPGETAEKAPPANPVLPTPSEKPEIAPPTPVAPRAETGKPAEPATGPDLGEKPEDPKAAPPKTDAPAGGDTSSSGRPRLWFVAVEKEKAKPEPASPSGPAPTKESTVPAAGETGPALALPDAAEKTPPAIAIPGAPSVAPGAKTDQTQAAASEKTTLEKSAASEKSTEPKPKYQPLAAVEGRIRQMLAAQKAIRRILDAMGPIESKMKEYRTARNRSRTEEGEDASVPPIDLAALAKAAGMTFHRVGLISPIQAQGMDIGLSQLLDFPSDAPEGRAGRLFLQVAYEGLPEYQPRISRDLMYNSYLFWTTEKTEERIPKFTDPGIRDEVLAVWKRIEARALARKRAEQLAEQARKDGRSLAESIGKQPGIEVFQTGSFTWLTTGGVPAMLSQTPPQLSQVEHVEKAGPDFMQAVYDLELGQTGVAMNYPRTIAYVIRLTDTTPVDKLWQQFKVDDYAKYQVVAGQEYRQLMGDWIKGLEDDAGLEWKREARRFERGE